MIMMILTKRRAIIVERLVVIVRIAVIVKIVAYAVVMQLVLVYVMPAVTCAANCYSMQYSPASLSSSVCLISLICLEKQHAIAILEQNRFCYFQRFFNHSLSTTLQIAFLKCMTKMSTESH